MSKTKKSNNQDLITATKSGDRLNTLIALRDLLADRLQNTTSTRDISSISKRLMQCISEIETLEEMKRQIEESPFRLSEYRKQFNLNKLKIDSQYALNSISAEHEKC